MDVERQRGLASDLSGQLKHLDSPPRKTADLGVAFDATDEITIGIGGHHCRPDVDSIRTVEAWIEMPFKPAHKVGRQEDVNPCFCRFRNEVAETWQRHAGRTALIDHCGDAGMDANHIRIETEAPA